MRRSVQQLCEQLQKSRLDIPVGSLWRHKAKGDLYVVQNHSIHVDSQQVHVEYCYSPEHTSESLRFSRAKHLFEQKFKKV